MLAARNPFQSVSIVLMPDWYRNIGEVPRPHIIPRRTTHELFWRRPVVSRCIVQLRNIGGQGTALILTEKADSENLG